MKKILSLILFSFVALLNYAQDGFINLNDFGPPTYPLKYSRYWLRGSSPVGANPIADYWGLNKVAFYNDSFVVTKLSIIDEPNPYKLVWVTNAGLFRAITPPYLKITDTTGKWLGAGTTIPAAQVNSDWNSVSGPSQILNKPNLSLYYLASNPNGYISSYTETDPLWTASPSFGITGTNITNWNTAFGWGNHALAGYITASSTNTLTNKSGNISMWTNDVGYITTSALSPYLTSSTASSTYVPLARTITINGVTQDLSSNRTWNVGDVLTLGSYANPSWITSLAQSKITYAGTNLQYIRGDGSFATFPTNVSTFTNDANYITRTGISATAPVAYNNSTGVISMAAANGSTNGYLTSTDWTTFNNKLSSVDTGNISNFYLKVRSLLSAGTGISYNNITGVITNTAPAQTPSFNPTPSRSLSTTGSNNTFTISSTRAAHVTYTINFSVALVLAVSNGAVELDYSLDGGSNWIPVSRVSQVFGVSITITTNGDNVLSGDIPANALVRINRTANSNCTVTLTTRQQEKLEQ